MLENRIFIYLFMSMFKYTIISDWLDPGQI